MLIELPDGSWVSAAHVRQISPVFKSAETPNMWRFLYRIGSNGNFCSFDTEGEARKAQRKLAEQINMELDNE